MLMTDTDTNIHANCTTFLLMLAGINVTANSTHSSDKLLVMKKDMIRKRTCICTCMLNQVGHYNAELLK